MRNALTKPLTALLAIAVCADPGFGVTLDAPEIPLSLVAEEAIVTAFFYAACVVLVASLIGISLTLRYWVWAAYSLLVFLGLLYIAFFEQNLTGITWIRADVSPEGLLLAGYAMYSVNFCVAAFAIPSAHRYARLKPALLIAAGAVWVFWLVGTQLSLDLAYGLFSAAGCGVAVAHFFPVSTFAKLRGGYDMLIRNLIWVLLTLVLLGAAIIITDLSGLRTMTAWINRILIATIIIAFTFLFTRHIFVLKGDREMAVQEALERAEEQVRITKELLAAEEKHAAALEVTRLQNMRLATASHDIRQPISSLRTTVAVMVRDQPEEIRQHLQTSLDYLDELAASYVEEARAAKPEDVSEDSLSAAKAERVGDKETVSTALIGETLTHMFRDDAAAKSLDLQVDIVPAEVTTEPLALMRILSNLMTNAITHGCPGPLSLRGEAKPQSYDFSVSNPGASDLAFEAWSKDTTSPGSGLGLAIVDQQAQRAGLSVHQDTSDPTRTCLILSIPVTV